MLSNNQRIDQTKCHSEIYFCQVTSVPSN